MHKFPQICLGLLCLTGPFSFAPRVFAAETITTDICVYGATSGGVIAAVQAQRMHKTVALTSFNNHIGGMTSGGLGWVDFGKSEAIGGLTREYFKRIGQRYGKSEPSYAVEPHVAEEEFHALLDAEHIPIHFNQRLDTVMRDGGRITQITMDDGTVYRAKMFIDASYEGDLMAKAGVSFSLGRESTAQYGESFAGVRSEPWKGAVSPYVIPGDPTSGLLPLIGKDAGIANGEADQSVMSCNYRLCLTQDPNNKIPLTAPDGYKESTYELLGRLIDAEVAKGTPLKLTTFIKMSRLPHGKTDVNNQFSVSTDFIGESHVYPTASYAQRAVIEQAHRDYLLGLLYYLATSPRVPAPIRTEMQTWGLAADEFKDTGGWPHQFYVREARRMVGDYVMLQQNVQGQRLAPDSVGLASYRVDSHSLNRFVRDGVLMTDGDLHDTYPKPYPISYRSIIPKKAECQNLFVPFALSASHVAFTSIRMEPVFMILSQSAATAAADAIDGNLAVQDIPYTQLKAQLQAEQQILAWQTPAPAQTAPVVVAPIDLPLAQATPNAALTSFMQRLAASQKQTVVVYGTSLTEGGAWTKEVKNWFDARFPGQVTFINSGMSSKNSDDGVANLQTKVLNHHPDLVFIEFAINDSHVKFNMSVEHGSQNLATIVDGIRAQNPHAAIVLQVMDVPWDAPNGNRSFSDRPQLQKFNDNYRNYAREHDAVLLDHNPAWLKLSASNPELYQTYLPDGLHPNTDGNLLVVWPAIKNLLEQATAAK